MSRRNKTHLLSLDRFASYADVMEVDARHNRQTGNRFECLFDDGSTLAARTVSDVEPIGDLARGCHAGESVAQQIKARLAALVAPCEG